MAWPWHWLDSAVRPTHPHLASRYDSTMGPQVKADVLNTFKLDRCTSGSACVTAVCKC